MSQSPAYEGTRVTARRVLLVVLLWAIVAPASAQSNRIDVVTPMAPELAAHGPFAVGVRTIEAVDRGRVDVLGTTAGFPVTRYDRRFAIEVWYPAVPAAGQQADVVYRTVTRDPARTVELRGRAVRDAAPAAASSGGHPLVIISHGYPGNRYLLSHLGENLASKGYVVAAPDHPDSTYGDQKAFASTLYNRPLDQMFVLDEIDRLSRPGSPSFLAGVVDAGRTAIVGYSMGGFGLISALGAGFTDAAVSAPAAPPNRLLFDRAASNPAFSNRADPRVKAAIAIAPYGGAVGMWNAEGLSAVTTPILFVAGSADDIVGYEKGVRVLFQQTTRADRHLLTFVNGAHNVAAPIPAPAEAWAYSEALKNYPFMHYEDGVWGTVRSNNILQHFATAFLSIHLKGDTDKQAYLALGVPLKGFRPRTTNGLTLEYLPAGK